jgi:hypothetical protein
MVPGGILSGIGWGAYAIAGPIQLNLENDGGLFLLIFGLGFGSITLLSAIFTDETHWWALIPGGIIAFIGVAVLFGGFLLDTLAFAGKFWPLVLIALGIYIVWTNSKKEKSKGIVSEEKL